MFILGLVFLPCVSQHKQCLKEGSCILPPWLRDGAQSPPGAAALGWVGHRAMCDVPPRRGLVVAGCLAEAEPTHSVAEPLVLLPRGSCGPGLQLN